MTANSRGFKCSSSSIALRALSLACASCSLRVRATRSFDRGVSSLYTPKLPVSFVGRKVTARFGCSPQAGSYRNKPRPSGSRTCLMHAKPMFPRDSFPRWCTHPVPIDISETCKLSHIEQRAAGAHFELVTKPRCMPTTRWIPTDPMPTSAFAVHLSSTARVRAKLIPTRCANHLRAPLFEVLRPAVVIRRRPQRNKPSVRP